VQCQIVDVFGVEKGDRFHCDPTAGCVAGGLILGGGLAKLVRLLKALPAGA